MKIKFDDKIAIYIQIMNYVKQNIVNGSFHLGDKLPSVREFSKELTVNPNTLQRAYQELEREGIIFTQRGMGSFISKDKKIIERVKEEMSREIVQNFLEGMKKIGFKKEEILNLVRRELEREDINNG
ncbi:GntR family transcriptional regulator [Clostridium botulinum]|uniref:GntR family transcriptional regulator n=3 Tax=Clostridium botulinum TaxID=1491 RepID=A0A2I4M6H8_CLOBO|nr:GntR family transcriptional regulator [Clostridium botulinum]AJD26875.1 bacterial regulatory s, gntR family protein [Clostridium botulinum CDC_297]ACO83627.1 transcriptional regulator, GntR family [Clostridium botulinum A2 str. Kyoto]ACQ53587.1 transcriptional regulator, GntR family [Clostridium botulinum Ba4 str. 657]AJE09798.1 bacterial regulatory s, gntR family protein [Clostridium botulinum CDC_1436]APC78644.1 bacterial regulatory s, gntR family protein [Clostridium botulinum]